MLEVVLQLVPTSHWLWPSFWTGPTHFYNCTFRLTQLVILLPNQTSACYLQQLLVIDIPCSCRGLVLPEAAHKSQLHHTPRASQQ
jgi:hypothetical protein